MAELTTEILITNVLNKMMSSLDDAQFKKLKDVLYIELHDVEVTNKCYDLVTTIQDNDTMKLEYYKGSLRIANKSEKTIAQYTRTVKCLRNFVGKNFADINAFDVKYYLSYHQNSRGWTDNTLKNNIHYLSSFFGFLYKEEIITKNPMDKVDSVQTDYVIKSPFSRIEMEKLRNVCRGNTREMALIEILVSSGIRVDELVRLNWNDLDFQRLKFIVHGKGSKEREVLFNERASFHLQKYFETRIIQENISRDAMLHRPLFVGNKKDKVTKGYERLTDNGIRKILKTVGKAAEISDISPHKFRRTFATECLERGMPIEELSVLMGHNQIDTTRKYTTIKTSKVDYSYRKYCA